MGANQVGVVGARFWAVGLLLAALISMSITCWAQPTSKPFEEPSFIPIPFLIESPTTTTKPPYIIYMKTGRQVGADSVVFIPNLSVIRALEVVRDSLGQRTTQLVNRQGTIYTFQGLQALLTATGCYAFDSTGLTVCEAQAKYVSDSEAMVGQPERKRSKRKFSDDWRVALVAKITPPDSLAPSLPRLADYDKSDNNHKITDTLTSVFIYTYGGLQSAWLADSVSMEKEGLRAWRIHFDHPGCNGCRDQWTSQGTTTNAYTLNGCVSYSYEEVFDRTQTGRIWLWRQFSQSEVWAWVQNGQCHSLDSVGVLFCEDAKTQYARGFVAGVYASPDVTLASIADGGDYRYDAKYLMIANYALGFKAGKLKADAHRAGLKSGMGRRKGMK